MLLSAKSAPLSAKLAKKRAILRLSWSFFVFACKYGFTGQSSQLNSLPLFRNAKRNYKSAHLSTCPAWLRVLAACRVALRGWGVFFWGGGGEKRAAAEGRAG